MFPSSPTKTNSEKSSSHESGDGREQSDYEVSGRGGIDRPKAETGNPAQSLPHEPAQLAPAAATAVTQGGGLLSSLAQKNLMALTGMFLCVFLVVHLLGNLQLLLPAKIAQPQFNFYSQLLSGNFVIQFISWGLLACILAHIFFAVVITIRNRRANGARYECDRRGETSKWYSRKMGLLGTVILFFLIIHLRDFWYQLEFGQVPLDENGRKDLYSLVVTVCRSGWYVGLYVVCMAALAYHLLHGFFSAARSLGLYHPRYVNWVRYFGWVYSVGVSGGFALVPVYLHFAHR